jgi:DNA-binding CsgD family transcriptional regulator
MISTEELSELLATLYAAPLQPEKWQFFFDQLSQLTKISSGYFISGSQSGYEVLAGGGFAWNQEAMRIMNERYVLADPFGPPFFRNPRIGVIPGEELVSQHQLLKTEFYNDFLVNNEMETVTMVSCTSTAERVDVMPVWRRSKDGPMDQDSVNLLRLVLPHAHLVLQMRTKLQQAEFRGLVGESALDAMSIAALLVSETGHVQHMNSLATDIVRKADGLRIERTTLKAIDSSETAKLQGLIRSAATEAKKSAGLAPGGALSISRNRVKGPLHVAVLPITQDRTSMAANHCALVIVSDQSTSPRSRASLLTMLYRLTPTEARLADLLLGGLEVRAVADHLGITIETARFHLKRVLAKTGTHRQTELIRLMLTLPGRSGETASH